jgi:hypothetical protein
VYGGVADCPALSCPALNALLVFFFLQHHKLADNSYKVGEVGGWGARANADLIKVKGKGFTREKNKKKRGAYRGGAIETHASYSIKFDD